MLSIADQGRWTAAREAQVVLENKPEVAARDQVRRVKLYTFLSEANTKILTRQKSIWRGYYMTGLRTALYYSGRQVLIPNSSGFGYEIVQLRGIDHPLYVYNKLRPFSDEVTALWGQSNPEVMFSVLDENDRKAESAIYEIEMLNGYQNRMHFTPEVLQLTAKGGQFCGNYHFETWYDPDAGNGMEWFEEYAPLDLSRGAWFDCLDCGETGEMPENARCQSCGSTSLSLVPMPGVNVPDAVEGNKGWKKAGDVACRPFPAWSMRYSLTTGAADSPYRYTEEDMPREVMEARYGRLPTTATDEGWGADESMHCERIMRRAARQKNQGYDYGEDDNDNILAQRFWHEPEMLANVALEAPETLPDGTVIPANERLSDVWPEGVCILTAPGMPKFLALTPESHKARWSDGRYGINFGQTVGAGIEDGVENQRQMNVMKSGTFRYLQKTLQPSIAVNGRVFKNPQLFNRVDNVITIANSALPEGTSIGNHFAFVTPPQINPQVMQHVQQMDADLQAALKAYNSQGDYAGSGNDTATAAKIGNAKQAIAHNLYLSLYAETIKDVACKRITLSQKHYGDLRLIQDVDTLTGQRRARQIRAVNLRTNFIAWVKTGSFLPNLNLEKRAEFMEGANAIGMLQTAGLLNPASLQKVNEVFHVDFSFERQREKVDECEDILEMYRMAVEANPMASPAELYLLSEVDPYTLGHDIKIHWYRDWLGSPEAKDANPALLGAIKMRIQAHYAAIVSEEELKALAANAGKMLLSGMPGQMAAPGAPPGGPGMPASPTGGPPLDAQLPPPVSLPPNPLAAEPATGMPPVAGGQPPI